MPATLGPIYGTAPTPVATDNSNERSQPHHKDGDAPSELGQGRRRQHPSHRALAPSSSAAN
ncbi:hypothetical protein CCMA1212_005564 [Trichoderma ghanense]|uniref:Uncharacterized protein n=1 Tax=Trichoderma ghanense TaxID=65468 RepID=A0ABY2H3K4_9HYPO